MSNHDANYRTTSEIWNASQCYFISKSKAQIMNHRNTIKTFEERLFEHSKIHSLIKEVLSDLFYIN